MTIIGTTIFERENLEFLNFIYSLIESKGLKMRDFKNEGNFNWKSDMTKKYFDLTNGCNSGHIFKKELVEYAINKEVLPVTSTIKNHKNMSQFEYLNIYIFNRMYETMKYYCTCNASELKCFEEITIQAFFEKTGERLFINNKSNKKIMVWNGFERKMKIKRLLN